MKIELISCWYNESFLAPFYLNHYSKMVDSIKILVDADTNDDTEKIIKQYPNTTVRHQILMNEFDILMASANRAYLESDADWVVIADADEFIFNENLHEFLAAETAEIVLVRLFQPFRNFRDIDLDPNLPIMGQRRYGDLNVVKGQNRKGIKPMIVRGGRKIKRMTGFHKIYNRHRFKTSETILSGQHWVTADPCFCIERKLSRKERNNTQNNIRNNYGIHIRNVTKESILKECHDHLNDKELSQ